MGANSGRGKVEEMISDFYHEKHERHERGEWAHGTHGIHGRMREEFCPRMGADGREFGTWEAEEMT